MTADTPLTMYPDIIAVRAAAKESAAARQIKNPILFDKRLTILAERLKAEGDYDMATYNAHLTNAPGPAELPTFNLDAACKGELRPQLQQQQIPPSQPRSLESQLEQEDWGDWPQPGELGCGGESDGSESHVAPKQSGATIPRICLR